MSPAPSDPAANPLALESAGSANSATTPAVVIRPIRGPAGGRFSP